MGQEHAAMVLAFRIKLKKGYTRNIRGHSTSIFARNFEFFTLSLNFLLVHSYPNQRTFALVSYLPFKGSAMLMNF